MISAVFSTSSIAVSGFSTPPLYLNLITPSTSSMDSIAWSSIPTYSLAPAGKRRQPRQPGSASCRRLTAHHRGERKQWLPERNTCCYCNMHPGSRHRCLKHLGEICLAHVRYPVVITEEGLCSQAHRAMQMQQSASFFATNTAISKK
mgnify:CR=1 FL=1